jgi:hypothetical protein
MRLEIAEFEIRKIWFSKFLWINPEFLLSSFVIGLSFEVIQIFRYDFFWECRVVNRWPSDRPSDGFDVAQPSALSIAASEKVAQRRRNLNGRRIVHGYLVVCYLSDCQETPLWPPLIICTELRVRDCYPEIANIARFSWHGQVWNCLDVRIGGWTESPSFVNSHVGQEDFTYRQVSLIILIAGAFRVLPLSRFYPGRFRSALRFLWDKSFLLGKPQFHPEAEPIDGAPSRNP